MELFVGPIESGDTIDDLKRLFKGFEKKASFQIVKLLQSTEPLYFGLVEIDSDRLARKALKKLTAARINGRRVCVREYQHRSGGNERRALNWRDKPWHHNERRLGERRKSSRREADDEREEEPVFFAYDNLSVKHSSN